jgi:hypothetical protein
MWYVGGIAMADTIDIMKEVVRTVIREELRVTVEEHFEGDIEVKLQLGDQVIGDPYYLKLDFDRDHRHGVDHITGLRLELEVE